MFTENVTHNICTTSNALSTELKSYSNLGLNKTTKDYIYQVSSIPVLQDYFTKASEGHCDTAKMCII